MLPCLNCKKEVASEEAKVFAEVFLCPACFSIAERLYTKGREELRMMQLVLKEAIRLSAVRGELQFPSGAEEVSKKDLITHLAKLAEETRQKAISRKACTSPPPKIPSKETMSLSAAAAEPPSNSGSSSGSG